ncbi:hypothetical protein EDEG_04216 [Edhazardia aedis USNM 41457]|uniref:Uncharacterized protein n=1 Tax=Edhazardia aedis (strain USNM 41457) TaxID=1003232 RepID=J9D9U9_EDHAE|nr:hypothetical protein EDEG_04216 [Edhazardia aedis USNM 41457]|eukprot:EJW04531.1 hypothetical protein EDEG_04216 [Edhazardia aedis USNM 41457]
MHLGSISKPNLNIFSPDFPTSSDWLLPDSAQKLFILPPYFWAGQSLCCNASFYIPVFLSLLDLAPDFLPVTSFTLTFFNHFLWYIVPFCKNSKNFLFFYARIDWLFLIVFDHYLLLVI